MSYLEIYQPKILNTLLVPTMQARREVLWINALPAPVMFWMQYIFFINLREKSSQIRILSLPIPSHFPCVSQISHNPVCL
jgi:hypothetical protein